MADARPNPFDFDVTKVFGDLRFRPFDVEAAWAAQRRNIELTREAFEGWSTLLRDWAQPASTEDRIAKHTEYAKQLLEKGAAHGREIASLAAKAGTDAAEVLHKRATEGLDEIRSFAAQQTAR